jgi:hypothetical protein
VQELQKDLLDWRAKTAPPGDEGNRGNYEASGQQVPLRRIIEITGVPAERLYNRIGFLAQQCRDFSAHKDKNLWKGFAGRNRVLCTDVQTILANWRHANRVLNVPIHHAVTVERDSGYIVAATTDFDPDVDSIEIEREMMTVDDFLRPRAWRLHGRVWAYDEYKQSILKGVQSHLSPEERKLASNTFDIPGSGARVRGDIFQVAHVMMVKKLIGSDYRQILHCIDGDGGLAKLSASLFAEEVIAGRVHVADVRFSKELGNRKRNRLVQSGEQDIATDLAAYARIMDVVESAYGLDTQITRLVAARLLAAYGAQQRDVRGHDLASKGVTWRSCDPADQGINGAGRQILRACPEADQGVRQGCEADIRGNDMVCECLLRSGDDRQGRDHPAVLLQLHAPRVGGER